jgi:hypothetical protein
MSVERTYKNWDHLMVFAFCVAEREINLSPLGGGGRLGVVHAMFHVLGPVAHVLVGVEHELRRARHVVLALALAHVVHGAVQLVPMVRDVTFLLLAHHGVSWKTHQYNFTHHVKFIFDLKKWLSGISQFRIF